MNIATQLELIQLKLDRARITDATCTEESLIVNLEDGRAISAPIDWFPRLFAGTQPQRENLIVLPIGIHWPDLDEDISLRTLLLGPDTIHLSPSQSERNPTQAKKQQVAINGHQR